MNASSGVGSAASSPAASSPARARSARSAEIVNPFWTLHRTLTTRLTPEQCAERLRGNVAMWRWPRTWFRPFHERPVAGSLRSEGFSIRKRIPYNSSHQTEADVRLLSAPQGTRVDVRLHPSRVTAWVEIVLGTWILAALLARVATGASPTESVPGLVTGTLAVLLAFVPVFHLTGRWIARGEDEFLIDFLRRTLDATDSPDPRPIR